MSYLNILKEWYNFMCIGRDSILWLHPQTAPDVKKGLIVHFLTTTRMWNYIAGNDF